MSKNSIDPLGDRCKYFENLETSRRADPSLPLIARLDGHGFSKFTKDIQKPFDPRFAELMALTTKHLVEKHQALVGYTQSDEITLIWGPVEPPHTRMFSSKYQKNVSLLAGSATGFFNRKLVKYLPEKEDSDPEFDNRVWSVPTLQDAVDVLVWRENDAIKNSVSMLASAHFSEKQVDRISSRARKEMLLEKGVDWNDCPRWAKRGRFYHRTELWRDMTADELALIPVAHRPTGPVLRSAVTEWDLPRLTKVQNLIEVIFNGATPVLEEASFASMAP